MFFLIFIVFIAQLIFLAMIISTLLSFDLRLIMANDVMEQYNCWLKSRKNKIENIFSDVKFIIQKKEEKLHQNKQKFVMRQIIAALEWVLFLIVKPRGKKFIAGYKLAKYLLKELSLRKNMI